jgi:glyoxylase-like metal-dependent hydrolase (beta-lactamase superfamily II)
MKTDDTLRARAAARVSVGDIDYRHVHASACRPCRLEHAARQRPLGADLPEGALRVRQGRVRLLDRHHAKTPVPPFGDSVLPCVEAKQAEIVRDDYQIGDHARILPTPGHTPGHVAFTFGRGKDDAVFSGDLMHSPLQTRYPELSVKFDVDQAQAATTAAHFLERYCDTDTLCCTAHFPRRPRARIRRVRQRILLRGI